MTPLGFVQDMMIAIVGKTGESYLEIQSQLRVGLKDYGTNDENLRWLLSYLKAKYAPIYQYPIQSRDTVENVTFAVDL
jgi:hypothetical protein